MITGKRVAWSPPMWPGFGLGLGLGMGDRIGIGIGMAWCHLHAAATLVKVMSRTKVSHNMHIPHTLVGKVLLWHLNTW